MTAIHLACYPERFNLPACTNQDLFVNKELTCQFHARWTKVAKNGSRAIDLAIKSGYDNALLKVADNEEALVHLEVRQNSAYLR